MDYDATFSQLIKRNIGASKNDVGNTTEDDAKESWVKDKEIFELQLNQLQEQLVAVMLENQQLGEENQLLKKQKGNVLKEALIQETTRRKKAENLANSLVEERKKIMEKIPLEQGYDDIGTEMRNELEITRVDRDKETDLGTVDKNKKYLREKIRHWQVVIWDVFYDRIGDFMNDDIEPVEEETEEALSVKKLKENITRFSDSLGPIKAFIKSLSDLFTWTNPWYTMTIFLIYIYSIYIEMLIPLCLMLILAQLGMNYLHVKGIASRFAKPKSTNEEKDLPKDDPSITSSITEKYTLIMHIATTVQNTLGGFADSLEKCESLLMWHHPDSTKELAQQLLILFLLACFLQTTTLLSLLGWAIGLKLFVVTPIYSRYPKVQARYDSFRKMWKELPTLEERIKQDDVDSASTDDPSHEINEGSMSRQDSPTSSVEDEVTSSTELDMVDGESRQFGDGFGIPVGENPLTDYIEGKRCTSMDKENPLTSMRHGRMYLTQNYICFERSQFHSKKNIAIKLTDIASCKKAKPIAIMPGQGMAIEIQVKGKLKPYLFGAMLGRDEVYESIYVASKAVNASWCKK